MALCNHNDNLEIVLQSVRPAQLVSVEGEETDPSDAPRAAGPEVAYLCGLGDL